ncbi:MULTISPECIES: FeoB-associated Cys-rich membrane protein [Weeksella]|uniref:Virus attachment protein p12 family protein n=1 Tax=Weeksella virosa (strain ATCC 43766 / DSM 16922 / JCM 21250 / CCUG 30538 / CDC 9751 / IAM 14551 / NBRC 16016 / NCTC 11634 / CL345/78) TaxID=865938 RepID=F0P2J0_WEEVC|nr:MULTISPECIES: FeoB-associated Cys-rich membrane protein [Weeksella]ADX67829.1 hypothetical protein Weevi_1120 [Weeksella virosa DSM 16922]MDK7374118.1 FeoB-associated Cys-rich membrane protein [Weeksella virosa]MDK7674430.1 FeoB-associated Cys-rich membrane protein [Weeksella virosa]SUP54132.1 Virus attachment protein p12 family [Weeksella virosa]VEH64544.1 Virus attachment protein p12 family [Weeksella virosa]
MSNIYVQYGFIAIVFMIAVWYIVKMIKDAIKGKKQCSKGCGCSSTIEPKDK